LSMAKKRDSRLEHAVFIDSYFSCNIMRIIFILKLQLSCD
jgi:hypothetical protein